MTEFERNDKTLCNVFIITLMRRENIHFLKEKYIIN